MKMRWKHALAASFAMAVAQPALAQPIANTGFGSPIIATTTDPIIATYLGSTAAYTDLLYLIQPGGDVFIFNNQTSPVGATVNLGTFAIGQELRFRLEITDFGGNVYNFFSGAPSRNSDNAPHAAVQNDYLTPGTTLASFEDLPNSTDFNDLSFSFTGTAAGSVPEPETWMLLILGMGLVGSRLRAKRRVTAIA